MFRGYPNFPFAPKPFPFFYGWVLVVVGAMGMMMSAPGQTSGVSAFTDHLVDATRVSRFTLSLTYTLGTIGSALLLPKIGIALDRFGTRVVGVGACVVLASGLFLLSSIDTLARLSEARFGLTETAVASSLLVVAFLVVRVGGQGALTITSGNMIAKWFDKRRGLASGLAGIGMACGIAIAPKVFSSVVLEVGWRDAWRLIAGAVIAMGVIALIFYRDTPEACGLHMDGASQETTHHIGDRIPCVETVLNRSQAVRTLSFWTLTLALATQGLIVTGFTFHLVDLGVDYGREEAETMTLFIPMAIGTTSLGLVLSVLADRGGHLFYGPAMLIFQIVGVLGLASFGTEIGWWCTIVGFGAAGAFFGPIGNVIFPAFFGRPHLGAIAGVRVMCVVLATAIGPPYLALCKDLTGQYELAFWAFLPVPLFIFLLSLRARRPENVKSDSLSAI